jgi:hypothetical protein
VLLLTAARISEVVLAGAEEVIDGTWTIPAARSKNHTAHTIKLGPWGQALMATEGAWIFKADRSDGPRKTGWYSDRKTLPIDDRVDFGRMRTPGIKGATDRPVAPD